MDTGGGRYMSKVPDTIDFIRRLGDVLHGHSVITAAKVPDCRCETRSYNASKRNSFGKPHTRHNSKIQLLLYTAQGDTWLHKETTHWGVTCTARTLRVPSTLFRQ